MARPLRVLVVDDEDAIRQTLAEVLQDEGYDVRTAPNGAEALEIVRAEPLDAVLLDLMMPVLDGWGFLQACRDEQICDGTPVVIMSAYQRLAETRADLNVNACILKPFELDDVLDAVQAAVRRAA